MTLHTRTHYWPAIYIAEWGLAIALALLLDEPQWLTILIASGLSIPATLIAKRYYYGDQNRHLLVMASLIMVTAFINVAVVGSHVPAVYMVWLVSITGGLMLVPMCYLVWNYLFQNKWAPLSSYLINNVVEFKIRHIALYSVLLVASILIQTSLPDELRRFAPFCMAIPIILLMVSLRMARCSACNNAK